MKSKNITAFLLVAVLSFTALGAVPAGPWTGNPSEARLQNK